jgi:hypothetical protein
MPSQNELKYYKKIRHISSLLPSFFDGILVPFIAVSDQPFNFGRLVLLLPVKG